MSRPVLRVIEGGPGGGCRRPRRPFRGEQGFLACLRAGLTPQDAARYAGVPLDRLHHRRRVDLDFAMLADVAIGGDRDRVGRLADLATVALTPEEQAELAKVLSPWRHGEARGA